MKNLCLGDYFKVTEGRLKNLILLFTNDYVVNRTDYYCIRFYENNTGELQVAGKMAVPVKSHIEKIDVSTKINGEEGTGHS